MTAEWEKKKIKDFCEFKYGKNLPAETRIEGPYPVYGSSSIASYHDSYLVEAPGIIIGRKGTVGKVQLSKDNFFPIDTTFYVDKSCTEQNVIFLYYLFQLCGFEDMNSDAAVPGLSRNAAVSLEVKLPPLDTQLKIAAMLSAYDDLIGNNLARIKLLEEMAQITYEEWFVRMQFPGHETAEINPDTGLPEGWETGSCFDSMEVLSGGTPKTNIEDYWNGSIKFFTPKDASDGAYTNITEKTITSLGMKKCNSQLYEKDTLFITARGTVGKLNLAHEPMAMNQSCYALRARDGLTQYFLYCALTKIIDAFKGAASGGVFDTIIIDTFKFLPFVKPKVEVVTKFDDLVAPLFSSMSNLLEQNRLLEEAKNTLLPRLMSGIIDIEKVELPEALLARVQANDTPEE